VPWHYTFAKGTFSLKESRIVGAGALYSLTRLQTEQLSLGYKKLLSHIRLYNSR
jgi:hypothetical protein